MTVPEESNSFLVGSEPALRKGLHMCYCKACQKPMARRDMVLIGESTTDVLLNEHLAKLP